MASNGRAGSNPALGTMEEKFICECGREFKSKTSLISHYRWCETHQKLKTTNKKVSKYKVSDNLYKCECGREFNNFQSLNAHFSHCDIHCNIMGRTKRKYPKTMYWENKTAEEINEIHKKSQKTKKEKFISGELNGSFKGKSHNEETKEKIRESTIKYLEKTKGSCKARYSIIACKYIDELNKKNNWNLQHAENGGEVQLFGYFVDGYDKNLNIVFEFDEPSHYIDIENNILKEKDIKRQNYIKSKLNCEFYRYNQQLDLLYKI